MQRSATGEDARARRSVANATRSPNEVTTLWSDRPWPVRPVSYLWQRRSFAWGRQRWWVELVIILAGYFVYEIIQGAAPAHRGLAFANGRWIHRAQVNLHIDLDVPINRLTNDHTWLALTTGYYYDTLHYLITPSVLLFVWIRHPSLYGRFRSALILASMSALVVFWAVPVAPPRFVVPGIVDTLVTHHIFGTVASDGKQELINDVAAMPSLHVGWALWCAFTIVGVTRSRWHYLAWLYPAATTFVVLGTGNHYLFDALGGLAILGIGFAVTRSPREVVLIGSGGSGDSGAERRAGSTRADASGTAASSDSSADSAAAASAASRSSRTVRAKRRDAQAPSTATPTGISAKYTNKR